MKVLIAGGAGFIGRRLCAALTYQETDVVVLSRSKATAEEALGDKVQVAEWDGKTSDGWEDHLTGRYGIINLAGESIGAHRWSSQRKQVLLSSRLDTTKALVDAIRQAKVKPKVFLQASGIGCYGDSGDVHVDERSPRGTGFLADLAKQWEMASKDVEAMGIRRVLLRSGVVLGPGGGALQKMLLPYRLFVGGPIGQGDQWFPWIHVEDEVRAITCLLRDVEAKGPFNLVAPGIVRQEAFAKALGQVMGRPSRIRMPPFILKTLLGEMAEELLLSGQKATAEPLRKLGFRFKFEDLEPALQSVFEGD